VGVGVSVAGGVLVGGGDDGSLVVGVGSSSSAGGAVSPVLLGKLVLLGGKDSREGSRVACGADDSFVVGDEGLSRAAGAAVLGVGRDAVLGVGRTAVLDFGRDTTGTGAGPAIADRSVAISRSLSPAHGRLELAAATPSRALLSTVSPSAPISAAICSFTRSITSSGWPMGLSESGANQERSETAITAAATTMTPASPYPRLAPPKRCSTKRLGGARKAGALTLRPSSSCLRVRFSIGFYELRSRRAY
jgi:hypothetical protein